MHACVQRRRLLSATKIEAKQASKVCGPIRWVLQLGATLTTHRSVGKSRIYNKFHFAAGYECTDFVLPRAPGSVQCCRENKEKAVLAFISFIWCSFEARAYTSPTKRPRPHTCEDKGDLVRPSRREEMDVSRPPALLGLPPSSITTSSRRLVRSAAAAASTAKPAGEAGCFQRLEDDTGERREEKRRQPTAQHGTAQPVRVR